MELSAEARWLLARAFSPPGAPLAGLTGVDPERTLTLGTALDLLERIAARTPREVILRDLGPSAAAVVRSAFEAACLHTALQRRVHQDVLCANEKIGAPVVFLKGAALDLAGLVRTGSRLSADVDVLVPRTAARGLVASLLDLGYTCPRERRSPHHLPPLRSPSGMPLELHTEVPGLRLGRARRPDADDLAAENGLRAVADVSGRAFIPTRPFLVAHAVVHGVDQHGLHPDQYPFARMLCDLSDLGVTPADLAEWHPLVDGDVSRREAAACVDLVSLLADSHQVDPLGDPKSAAGTLLRHLLAGTCDSYRKAIEARSVLQRGFAPRRRRLLRQAWRALSRARFGPALRWCVETLPAPWRLKGRTERV